MMEQMLFPLSYAQQNIEAQELVASGTDVNVLYFVLKAGEPLRHDCLEQAVNLFLRENPGARTQLTERDGSYMQYIAPYAEQPLRTEDLRSLRREEQEESFRRWGHRPFRLLDAPLVEFRHVLLSDTMDGLFCKFHHIWCDGWATGLLWSEIFTNYLEIRDGKTPEHHHPSPVDFLPQEQEYAGSAQEQEDRAFWQETLRDLSLGESYLTPDMTADRSATRRVFHLSSSFSQRVKEFARSHKLQPYILFTAALCLSFYQRADCQDVVMGMPRLNRDTEAERDTVGMFVMELPLRCTPDPKQTFPELCRAVAARAGEAAQHKKYSLTKIVENISSSQDLGRDLIDASVSYQKTRIETGEYQFPIDVWFGDPSSMMGNLILHVLDLFDDSYTVFYDHRKVLFNEDEIRRLHEGVMQILETALSSPELPIGSYSVVAPEEKDLLDRLGQLENLDPPSPKTVVDLFEAQAAKTPDRCAVRGADGTFTYTELSLRANAVANALLARTGPGERLTAVMLPRGTGVLVSVLGILKAGQGFLFLEPTYPQDRIAYMLENAAVSCVITEEEFLPLLPQGISILPYSEAVSASQEKPRAEILPQNLCYCIYTSGTTGRPKGVLIEHRGLVNLAHPTSCPLIGAVARYGKSVLAIGSLSFDISVLEIFTPLLNGVTVCFASQEEIDNPALLGRKMQEEGTNVLFATPSRLISYLGYEDFRQAAKNLEVLMSGGEAFQPLLWEKLRGLSPRLHVFNAYGPTEVSIVTTVQEVFGPNANLGHPVRNLPVRILGRRGQLLPAGCPGELCVGGVGLARGYQNLPEETAARFITADGERMYRTGDLVRWSRSGELLYLGRMDDQVKLRGLRIELGEIEAVLSSVPDVSNCCVLLKNDGKTQFLCGYFTATREIPVQELKDALSRKLPYYMVPSAFLQIPEMPTTSSGKTDKKALAALKVSVHVEYRAPETKQEELLCEIIARLLEKDRIGTEDNFFEIGGDSLLAAHLAIEAEAAGISLKYSTIFSSPTVRLMCSGLKQEEAVQERPEIAAFDYGSLAPLLTWKQDASFEAPPKRILLAGSTGYLGLHVLRELIETTDSFIICMARAKGKLTAEQRLKTMLFYYFGDSFDEAFETRLAVLEGDLTKDDVFAGEKPEFQLAINCAADVSHFTYGEAMYQINVDGMRRLASLCLEQNAALLHISTPTVGQFGLKGRTEYRPYLTEEDFYFHQDLSNDYAASKFLGEREVLTAIQKGLKAHILRVGNLQGRFSDGEFQINHATNAFTARLKAYIRLGFAPRSVWESDVDYSPVDCTAQLIVKFAGATSEQPIFHIFNDKRTSYRIIFESLRDIGYEIACLEDSEYEARISEILTQPDKRELLVDIISELEGSAEGHYEIGYVCRLTAGILGRSGFHWPEISRDYLVTCLTNLDMLGAFGL